MNPIWLPFDVIRNEGVNIIWKNFFGFNFLVRIVINIYEKIYILVYDKNIIIRYKMQFLKNSL